MKPEFFCCIGGELKDTIQGIFKCSRVFIYRAAENQTIDDMLVDGFFNEADDIRVNDLIILYCPEQTRAYTFAKVSSIIGGIVKTKELDTPNLPANVSAFFNDAGYLTASDLATVALTGNLSDLNDTTITNPATGEYLRWNGSKWINMAGGGGGSAVWGSIGGDIEDQADLQLALAEKADVTDLANKANVDMDNLTDTGANIANWSHNVTNCITEIPQDIKLEVSGNTVTLKAGSKVYIPNGFEPDNVTLKFDNVIIDTDKTLTVSVPGTYMICYNPSANSINVIIGIADCSSGSTWSASSLFALRYNTTENLIKFTDDTGLTWSNELTFPLCIATVDSNNNILLNNIFNGFGYIGTETFVLPGVKGLIPNGRNPDGTCKSTELSFTDVKVHDLIYNNETSHYCILTPNGLYGYGAESIFVSDTRPLPTIDFTTHAFWYDVPNNYIWTTNDNGVTWSLVNNGIFVGSMQKPSPGNIASLNPDQPFKAIDRSDIIDLLEMIYPVGAIYTTTVNSTECPMRLVIPGSTWQLVATDRALWGGNGSNAGTTIAAGLPDGRGAFTESGANVTSVGGGMHKASSYSAGWGSTGGDNTATVEYRNSWWNSMYGASNTVQPPAYRVNVWRRTA